MPTKKLDISPICTDTQNLDELTNLTNFPQRKKRKRTECLITRERTCNDLFKLRLTKRTSYTRFRNVSSFNKRS